MENEYYLKPNETGDQSWVKSHGFSHGGLALLWVVCAFLLFQFFGGLIALFLVMLKTSGFSGGLNPQQIVEQADNHIGMAFFGNSIGQLLFLAFATWIFCRLHVNKSGRTSYLRFQSFGNTPKMIGIVILLMLAVQPVIWLLGWLNTLIPLPKLMHSIQVKQMGGLKDYLKGAGHIWLVLLNVAIVPAFCEEILFRGYAFRSFQKSWGVITAMVVSGLIFGLFHLEPVNFIPLASIGILLAFLAWVTQSIFPAMAAHFVNNGASVFVVKYYPHAAFSSTTANTMPPPGLVILSIFVSGILLYLLFHNKMNPRLEI